MTEGRKYEAWLASRRAVKPSPDLTERIMAAVADRHVRQKCRARLADRMNESTSVRRTACAAAFLVGLLPFVFVAYMAELLVF